MPNSVKLSALSLSILVANAAFAENLVIDQNTPTNGGNNQYGPTSSSNNTVSANNFNNTNATIFGGTGTQTSGNTLTITNSTIREARGGSSNNSSGSISENNILSITDSTLSFIASGGYGANTLQNNKFYSTNSNYFQIYGASAGSNAYNNFISVNGGTIDTVSGANVSSIARGNTAIVENITGGSYLLGSRAISVDYNRIVMINSSFNRVYGGETDTANNLTSATYNTVELRGASSVGDIVYGGVLTAYNTPILDSYEYDLVTGNKLIIAPTTQSIRVGSKVANFSLLEFDFSDFPTGITTINDTTSPAALSVGNEARLLPGGVIANISLTGINKSEGRVNLIEVDPTGIVIDFAGTAASDIPGLGSYDFLSITPGIDNNGYRLFAEFGMNWFFTDNSRHGIFTLNGDDEFSVGVVLDDKQANPNNPVPGYNWDGISLTKRGTGTLILEEANTYTGLTTIEAGTLQLGDGGNEGSIATVSNILNNGVLAVNRNDDFTLANAISGTGAVTYSGTGILRIANSANSYEGGTNVTSGTLAITALDTLGDGPVNSTAAVLFDNAQGNFANAINGTGTVTFSNGSNVRLLAAINASSITIDAANTATIADPAATLSGTITNNGTLAIDLADDYTLTNLITGTGQLNQIGSGRTLISNSNTYTGNTNINQGTLLISNVQALGSTGIVNNNSKLVFLGATGDFANAINGAGNVGFSNAANVQIMQDMFASDATVDAGSTATLAAGTQWYTNTSNSAGSLLLGQGSTLNGVVSITGTLGLAGTAVNADVVGNVSNAGNIRLDTDNSLGSNLRITGDYVGNNGTLWLNTQLDDDASATDLLSIVGNARGRTLVQVSNIGGAGDETDQGIRIIETTTSTSDAFYLRDGYLSAGAFEYVLLMRGEAGQDNWYLTNNHPEQDGPTYTPGLGSVLANTQANNSLFNLRYEDRAGAGQSQRSGKPEDNLWIRTFGNKNKFSSLHGQLHSKGHGYGVQAGVGLPGLLDDEAFDIGVMASTGRYTSKTHSSRTERKSTSTASGYSLGLYGTWFSNPTGPDGLYVDSWLQWNHFNNRIKGADDQRYKYDASGITASIEVGQNIQIAQFEHVELWVQPQAQVVYQGVRADKFEDSHDISVKRGSDNVQARVGVKTYVDNVSFGDSAVKSRPFVELNYIHNSTPYSAKIDTDTYQTEGGRNLGEVRFGLESKVANEHQLWADISYAAGSKKNRDASLNIGWRYDF